MTQQVSRTFPRRPRELVESMLSEDYQRTRSSRLGGTAMPTVVRDGDKATVRFPRRLPLESLPGPLRSLAGTGEITQVEKWETISDDRCSATWSSESSLPGKAGGTFEVVPEGDGTRWTVIATVEVKVPLIGGRISKEAEAQVVKLIEAEMDLAEEYLASQQ
ncbi:MAG TPA: DUF2505 domain-containing protein [Frankiaceae bacterium]|nr:DUF2505 domain-containing protein [Frankiaceae bacterium]